MCETATAAEAARAWGQLPAAPESMDGAGSHRYRLTFGDGRTTLLRCHAPELKPWLAARMRWIEALADTGFACPWPQRTGSGQLMLDLGPDQAGVTVEQWLTGAPLQLPADAAEREALFVRLGETVADLHLSADAIADDGLPEAARFPAESPDALRARMARHPQFAALSARKQDALRDVLGQLWDRDPAKAVQGAIHGQLRLPSFLIDDGQVYLTGLHHACIGDRLQDLAYLVIAYCDAADFPALRAALLSGYRDGGGELSANARQDLDFSLIVAALKTALTQSPKTAELHKLNAFDHASIIALGL